MMTARDRKIAAGSIALTLGLAALFAASPQPSGYDKVQDARITALEKKLASSSPSPGTAASSSPIIVKTPPPTPSPTSPPPAQVIRVAIPSTTLATLQSWAADQSVDQIEFSTGTYAHFGTLYLKQARTRPLRWFTDSGVVFDGTGVSGTGAIHIATLDGPGTPTAAVGQMTFDFTGSVFQNYTIASFGLLMTGWVNGIEFDNVKVRSISGSSTLSHVFYIESDKVHHGTNVTIKNADVVGPGKGLFGSGVQVFAHDTPTGTNNVSVIGGTWSSLNRFTYAYSDATGFLVDGATIANVSVPIEAPASPPLNQISGTIKNTHATSSGANLWNSPTLTNGGGNSFN